MEPVSCVPDRDSGSDTKVKAVRENGFRPADTARVCPETRTRFRTWAARGVLALVLLAPGLGCSSRSSEGEPGEPPGAATSVARLPLPELSPGVSRGALESALASWPAGRRYAADTGHGEGWEWSGPDGMRVEARLRDGRVVGCRVSRTWGTGAPPVDGHHLPDAAVGRPLSELEARIGAGLLVERGWAESPAGLRVAVVESYRWAIHDRGVDTGLFLVVVVRDGVVAGIAHRWSGA